ncbi:pyridoxal 5'-phosphate synthase glutaminase subunit PdxT [Natronobacterium gregoryi]|uniref:Pyridoxal 5'-phosphate synthase subunit PdxT n=2 Tax=Natronobacterium gregoryi TaxID=44930 RepID=L0AJI4_NATGS|nr:pyridoxal 5'-phosphate synthase glutaminase subunit PdxT [Natronobacterium gregoryi]AFZ73205.1 pyridoxal 5'-phosphate synthase, glutaminase subunit Pdx2 [Natronobacterium gregoryi SP2]ELY71337.1 glutamine amidotransferase subunit PdxT [Natronobacterium gregoryi SP2]PLK21613.1 pyridoxal 5'-phosphate synthase glutaminase subunit PdxT [Natronobacterium gregoryi SP2]SFI58487.1 5'-phosphate synthase pdxT subunit [Natronobacterium gregoryi]
MTLEAGVVAVQGDVDEHVDAIERAASAHDREVVVHEIRESGIVPDCDLLAVPGGESTTISRLLHGEGVASEIRNHVDDGSPLLATCAGLIVASSDAGDDRVDELGLLDVTVERNAFGRQRDSFEAPLEVVGLEDPYPAVFIRAPAIDDVGDADVLASWDGRPVAVRAGPVVATAFHPELTADSRIHDLAFFENEAASVPSPEHPA